MPVVEERLQLLLDGARRCLERTPEQEKRMRIYKFLTELVDPKRIEELMRRFGDL